MLVNELQAVPVSGDDDALPVLFTAELPHGADHVIGLPAFRGINGDVHGGEHLLHNGHLDCQLIGHAVAVGLVALIFQVPEGGAVEVEGHAYRIGLLLLLHPLQNVQKSVDGIGIQPIPGGQRLDAEEGPVDDAVAVQNH